MQDIAGNLRTANTQLAGANTRIDATRSEIAIANARLSGVLSDLEATNTKLLDTNTKLVDVQGGLTRVDTTNTSLGTLDSQLSQMQASLTRIDGHLASLRQTLSAVDGMIPFLDLGTGSNEPVLPVPPATTGAEGTASEASAGQGSSQAGGQPATAPSERPQATSAATGTAPAAGPNIAGVWVSALAGSADAWLLRSDGTFVIATGSTQTSASAQPKPGESTSPNRISLQGRWRIEPASHSSPSAAAAPPARPELVLRSADGTTVLARCTIEQQSVRSLTLNTIAATEQTSSQSPIATGGLVVLRRP